MALDWGGSSGGTPPAVTRDVDPGAKERWDQGKASVSATVASVGVATPAALATPTPQLYTPEQLAAAGYTGDWFGEWGNIFNPSGNATAADYAGQQIASGYYDPNTKTWNLSPYMAGQYQANQLRNAIPNAPTGEYMNIASSAAFSGLSDLINQIKNYSQNYKPGNEDQMAYVEQMMGLEPGSYRSTMQGMNEKLQGGIGGMQGLSQEETSAFNRQAQNEIMKMREETRDIINALGGAGRSIAAYDAMEAAAGQITDYTLSSKLELLTQNIAKQEMEYNALSELRDQMVSEGVAGVEQYDAMLTNIWNESMGAYAKQISAMVDNNTGYSQQLSDYSQALLNSMAADQGVSTAALDYSSELYAMHLLPLLDEKTLAALDKLLKDLGG
jgi:hypothetical protein